MKVSSLKNKVQFIGRATADAELKNVGDAATEVAKFSIAVNDGWKDKESGQWVDEVDFFNCEKWRSNEYVAERVKKGNLILVEGKMKTRKYENKEGVNVLITFLLVDEIIVIPKPKAEVNEGAGDQEGQSEA